jgi:hypothetical protein
MRFCPRCGLADAKEAWLDTSPVEVAVGRRAYRVMDRIAVGSVCAVYRCRFEDGGREVEGVFKVARDVCSNALVVNESAVLRKLHVIPHAGRFTPFLPHVADTLGMADGGAGPARQANVLRMHDEIRSPDELYTLAEVRAHYPDGLDPRHVAWIWRRLLTILGFIHSNDVVHAAVLPMHVMIEPREHKLLLIDWCCAVASDAGGRPVRVIASGYMPWYKRQGALGKPPTAELDIGLGARCMIELLGGDPVTGDCPPGIEPGLVRYFGRCLAIDPPVGPDAWRLLDDFDRLIEALWGRRRFMPLALPPKQRA